jgi:peroxiredoxin
LLPQPGNKNRVSVDPSSRLLRVARWLSFLAAVGLGAALGWRLLLAPGAQQATAPPTIPDLADLVQPIGSPAAGLGSAVRVGSPAPDFTLLSLAGPPVSLHEQQGKVVLINFWATWCAPCREEMPALQAAYEKLADQGLVVLGVNWTQADYLPDVEAFVEALGLTFPILLDSDGTVSEDLYRVLGLPTSVLVGRDGMIRAVRIGVLDLQELEPTLQVFLAELPEASTPSIP